MDARYLQRKKVRERLIAIMLILWAVIGAGAALGLGSPPHPLAPVLVGLLVATLVFAMLSILYIRVVTMRCRACEAMYDPFTSNCTRCGRKLHVREEFPSVAG